ncbi:hypothetical protein PZH37_13175, partial [[Eubacterium] siraeum]|nr:hypothetical protein [[Eubacterium] siraeum]
WFSFLLDWALIVIFTIKFAYPREKKTTRVLALLLANEGKCERHKSIKSSQPWERSPFLTKEEA